MNRSFFSMQIKRCAKAYPGVLIIILLTIAAVVLAAVYSVRSVKKDDSKIKLQVGLVNNSGEPLMKLGLSAFGSIDDSIGAVDIIEMSEDEAKDKMKSGDVSAYAVIPRNYISNIQNGSNDPATIYMPPRTASIASFLARELTEIFSELITETQTAIYSTQDAISSEGVHVNMDAVLTNINLLFFEKVMGRGDSYDLQLIDGSKQLPIAVYYICAGVLLLLMLWGIAYSRIFINREYALYRVLASKGVGALQQVISEYVAFALFTFISALILSIAAGVVFGYVNTGIDLLENTNVLRCSLFAFKILPVVLAITAMQFFIYESASGIVGKILSQFIALLACGYLSGLFYPSYFFPSTLRAIGSILPTGAGLSYLESCLRGGFDALALLMLIAYTILLAAASVGARKLRMEGGSI